MIYNVLGGELEISVSALGAELVSVKLGGKERLWQGDERWRGHAPVLFPYCGKTTVCVNGKTYPVKNHGIARSSEFTLVDKTDKSLTFKLCDNEKTREFYPFSFEFYVTYAVSGNKLDITYKTVNTDKTEIYFACGGHESFILDYPIENYSVKFEKTEKLDSLCYDEGLTGEIIPLGETDLLPMPVNVLKNSDTAIFGGLNSRKVSLIDPFGKTINEISFSGFENLLLWRPQDANMICIEPWQNLPDVADEPPREFAEIKGVTSLAAGKEITFSRSITYN